jgi:hypothetical protein
MCQQRNINNCLYYTMNCRICKVFCDSHRMFITVFIIQFTIFTILWKIKYSFIFLKSCNTNNCYYCQVVIKMVILHSSPKACFIIHSELSVLAQWKFENKFVQTRQIHHQHGDQGQKNQDCFFNSMITEEIAFKYCGRPSY